MRFNLSFAACHLSSRLEWLAVGAERSRQRAAMLGKRGLSSALHFLSRWGKPRARSLASCAPPLTSFSFSLLAFLPSLPPHLSLSLSRVLARVEAVCRRRSKETRDSRTGRDEKGRKKATPGKSHIDGLAPMDARPKIGQRGQAREGREGRRRGERERKRPPVSTASCSHPRLEHFFLALFFAALLFPFALSQEKCC